MNLATCVGGPKHGEKSKAYGEWFNVIMPIGRFWESGVMPSPRDTMRINRYHLNHFVWNGRERQLWLFDGVTIEQGTAFMIVTNAPVGTTHVSEARGEYYRIITNTLHWSYWHEHLGWRDVIEIGRDCKPLFVYQRRVDSAPRT